MKISKSTIVRTILVAVVVINFLLEKFGLDIIKTDEGTVMMAVEALIEVAVIIVGFWKNNSYSQNAIKADKFLSQLRESE